MSDREWDSSEWQLGMELPSRKDKHGSRKSKKKSDRKLEMQPVGTPVVPPAKAPEPQRLERPQPEPRVEPKTVTHRTYEAVPEDPKYAQQQTFEEEATAKRSAFEAVPAKPQDAERQALAEVAEPQSEVQQVEVEHGQEPSSPEASAAPVDMQSESDAQQDAVQQLQASWDESAATLAVPAGGMGSAVGSGGRDMAEDEAFLRDLLARPEVEQEPSTKQDTASDAEQGEDNSPVISKWKIALLILITPIMLVVVLAWGKLAYVHQVPNFVQQQVPTYQDGKGFLILKPWWFGPAIFTLSQYPLSEGEDFVHWKIQLNDYEAVVQDPTVLYTFPEDILK